MDYSDKVMDHFANPRNCRPMEDADGVGQVGNPTCGDLMTIYIKVEDDKIADISFQKTLDEALAISRNDVAEELDGLPPIKMHCSNLAADGLQAAIENYYETHQS